MTASPRAAGSLQDAAAALPIEDSTIPYAAEDPTAEARSPADKGRKRLARNAVAGGAANVVKIGLQLLMLPLMAHFLGPAEYGLYALALPTVSFFMVLADGGLGISLAREDERATPVWSTAFWVLAATGLILMLIVVGWGAVLARLSDQPRLAGIMALLSTTFLLTTLSVPAMARLTRRADLTTIAAADAASALLGAAVAVAMAAAGGGAWSLAVQFAVVAFTRAAVVNAAAFERPTLDFDLSTLRQHLSTGGSVVGSRLAEFGSRLVENLILGRIFGAASLGAYTFANQTPRFLCEAASNPLWAALYAQALHEEPLHAARLQARLARLLAITLFPAVGLLAAGAPQIIGVVLGAKWASAAPMLQIIVCSYAVNVIGNQGSAILLANGRNAITAWLIAGCGAARVMSVCAGFWTGLLGVAWGICAANVLYACGMFAAGAALTGQTPWSVVREMARPGLASTAGAVVCWAVLGQREPSLGWLLLAIVLGGATTLAGLAVLDGKQLRSDAASIRHMLLRRRAA